MANKRVNIKAILADPKQRREMAIRCVIATQAHEGVVTTREQAEAAVDKVAMEKSTAQIDAIAMKSGKVARRRKGIWATPYRKNF